MPLSYILRLPGPQARLGAAGAGACNRSRLGRGRALMLYDTGLALPYIDVLARMPHMYCEAVTEVLGMAILKLYGAGLRITAGKVSAWRGRCQRILQRQHKAWATG